MKKVSKKLSKEIGQSYPSILKEERPDLDGFIKSESIKICTEKIIEKPSLPDHLYNPYVYIKKVLDKSKAELNKIDHPDIWNYSCNQASKRINKTIDPNHSDTAIDSEGDNNNNTKPMSPSRLKSQEERKKAYAANANLRKFVYDFFAIIKAKLTEIMENDQKEGVKTHGNTDLTPYFKEFCERKGITFKLSDKLKKTDKEAHMLIDVEKERYYSKKNDETTSSIKLQKEEKVREDKNKYISKQQFYEFLRYIGFSTTDYNDITKFFDFFADNLGSSKDKVIKISGRAFIFNYKKYLKEARKIRNILSEKESKQRNIDFRLYLKKFLETFEAMKTEYKKLENDEIKLRELVYKYLQNDYNNNDNNPNNNNSNLNQEDDIALIEKYKDLINKKTEAILNKKIILRFMDLRDKREPISKLIDFDTLNKLLDEIQENKTKDMAFISNFIRDFKKEKQLFKEDTFTLFEVVNFIHEKKISKNDLDLITYYVNKLKKVYNTTRNLDKNLYVQPKAPIPNELLSFSFDLLCQKAEKENEIVTNFLQKMEAYLQEYEMAETNERVAKIIHHNVVGDFLLKYFDTFDQNLMSLISRLQNISKFLNSEDIGNVYSPLEIKKELYNLIDEENRISLQEKEAKDEAENEAKKLKALNGLVSAIDQKKIKNYELKSVDFEDIKNLMETPENVKLGEENSKITQGKKFEMTNKDSKKGVSFKVDNNEDKGDADYDIISLLNDKSKKNKNDITESIVFGDKTTKPDPYALKFEADLGLSNNSIELSNIGKTQKVFDILNNNNNNALQNRDDELNKILQRTDKNRQKEVKELQMNLMSGIQNFDNIKDIKGASVYLDKYNLPYLIDKSAADPNGGNDPISMNIHKYSNLNTPQILSMKRILSEADIDFINHHIILEEIKTKNNKHYNLIIDNFVDSNPDNSLSQIPQQHKNQEFIHAIVLEDTKVKNPKLYEQILTFYMKCNPANTIGTHLREKYDYDFNTIEGAFILKKIFPSLELQTKSQARELAKANSLVSKPEAASLQNTNTYLGFQPNNPFNKNLSNSITPIQQQFNQSLPISNKQTIDPKKFAELSGMNPLASNIQQFMGQNGPSLINNQFQGTANKFGNIPPNDQTVQNFPRNDFQVNPNLIETIKSFKLDEKNKIATLTQFYGSQYPHANQPRNKIPEARYGEIKDPDLLTKSVFKEKIDEVPQKPDVAALGNDKPQLGRFSDYEMLLPPEYYAYLAKKNVDMDDKKWFIRSHHIETLTEHPHSVKDNLLGAEYKTYYSELPAEPKKELKTIHGEKILGNKEELISQLEENRKRIQVELAKAKAKEKLNSTTIGNIQAKNALIEYSKLFDLSSQKVQGPELMVNAYEGILDQLRAKEKDLLNMKRTDEFGKVKPPTDKWWELRDPTFIEEYKKHIFMVNSKPDQLQKYLELVNELQNDELV